MATVSSLTEVPVGGAIRWTQDGRTYLALRTKQGWWTTASENNPKVPHIMSTDRAALLLAGRRVEVLG
jgi:hypothetical protein